MTDVMRAITIHKSNAVNDAIDIAADTRDADNGNASHEYQLHSVDRNGQVCTHLIRFQYGPVKEVGVNGITNESLLAIVIDRLQGFQSSKFSCRENALALTKIQEGLMWLQERTRSRQERGVEGTLQV